MYAYTYPIIYWFKLVRCYCHLIGWVTCATLAAVSWSKPITWLRFDTNDKIYFYAWLNDIKKFPPFFSKKNKSIPEKKLRLAPKKSTIFLPQSLIENYTSVRKKIMDCRKKNKKSVNILTSSAFSSSAKKDINKHVKNEHSKIPQKHWSLFIRWPRPKTIAKNILLKTCL